MIRTLLVDDEKPARERLRQMLASFEDVEVIAEAVDGEEAIEKSATFSPDLVFLDIQMPGRNGLDVAASLSAPRPHVIFCTAFDQYAIEAFDIHAVDYLLKPVNRSRLAKAVSRVRESLTRMAVMDRDLQSAGEVQARLFPQTLPTVPGLDYQVFSRPARTVNGDYYDFLPLKDGKLAIALGDVSGKGIPAGLLMASLQGRVQSHAPLRGEGVGTLVTDLNRMMSVSTDSKSYVTFFYAVYDSTRHSLAYVNAGHNPPLLFRPGLEEPVRLSTGGMVIGLFTEAEYSQETIRLEPSDVLVCYTDGISEAANLDGEEFGESRLSRLVSSHREKNASGILEALMNELSGFVDGTTQQDDQTALVVKVNL
jgi:sigma-B regulation protein RsbU (phosphoserine phosphatase)